MTDNKHYSDNDAELLDNLVFTSAEIIRQFIPMSRRESRTIEGLRSCLGVLHVHSSLLALITARVEKLLEDMQ